MEVSFSEIVGYFGMLILVLMFAFGDTYKLTTYHLWNGIGAICMIFYSLTIGAYPFAILNAMWLLAAIAHLKDDIVRGAK